MNKTLSILLSMLLLTSVVSAAFIGGNFKALQDKIKESAGEAAAPVDDTADTNHNKENIIVVRPINPAAAKPDPVDTGLPSDEDFEGTPGGDTTPPMVMALASATTAPIKEDHSVVVVGLKNGDIHAYDSQSMKKLWFDVTTHKKWIQDIQFYNETFGSKEHDIVYIAGDGKVSRHFSNNGTKIRDYDFSTNGELIYSVAIDSGNIYAGDGNGKLYKMAKSGNTPTWTRQVFTKPSQFDYEWDNVYAVRLSGENLYVAGGTGFVYEYNTDGTRLATIFRESDSSNGANDVDASKMYCIEEYSGTLYFPDSTTQTNHITVVDDGDIEAYPSSNRITADYQTKIYNIAVAGGWLFTAQKNKEVAAYKISEKAAKPPLKHATGEVYDVEATDKYLFTGSADNKLRRYTVNYANSNPASGTPDTYTLSDDISAIGAEYNVETTNENPQIVKPLSDQTINEDAPAKELFPVTDHFADFETGSLGYSISIADDTLAALDVNGNGYVTAAGKTNQNGASMVTITATDGSKSATGTFKLTVKPVNDKPAYDNNFPAYVEVTEDTPKTVISNLNNHFSDADGDTLSFEVDTIADDTLLSASVPANTDDLYISPKSNKHGSTTVTIKAMDNQGLMSYALGTLTVKVVSDNDGPYLTVDNIQNQYLVEDEQDKKLFIPDSYFDDKDGDTLIYTFTPADATLATVTCVNGYAVASGLKDQTGNTIVTVNASDNKDFILANFTLYVTPVNDAPYLNNTIPHQYVDEDIAETIIDDLGDYFADVDNAKSELKYSLSVSDTSLFKASPANGGIGIRITPQENQNGTGTVNVTVRDPDSASNWTSFKVTVNEINDWPKKHTELEDKHIPEGSKNRVLFGDLDQYFYDPDGENLSYDPDGRGGRRGIGGDNDIGIIPGIGGGAGPGIGPGTNLPDIPFDPCADWEDNDRGIKEGNDPGNARPIDDPCRPRPKPLAYEVDPTYDTGLVEVWTVGSKVYANTTTPDGVGQTSVTIIAKDRMNATNQSTFILFVDEANDAPVLVNYTLPNAYVNVSYYYDVDATDADGDTLTYFTNDTSLFTIDPQTGEISFLPAQADVGSYAYRISVTDGLMTDHQDVTLLVIDNLDPDVTITSPVNNSYVSTLASANQLNLTYTSTATDIAYYNVSMDNGAWINNSLNMYHTFTVATDGAHNMTVVAHDGSANTGPSWVNFTLDNTVPDVNITSINGIAPPVNNSNFTTPSITLRWAGTDNYGISYYTINGVDVGTNTSHNTTLPDGTYTYTVVAYDLANNTDADSITFNIDATPPDVNITYPDNNGYVNSNVFNVTWIGTGVSYYVDNSSTNVGLATNDLQNLPDGNYTYTVTAYDSFGNTDSDTANFTVDTKSPRVTITSPLNITYGASWVWVNATTNETASWCGYSLDNALNVTMSGSGTSWYYNASGLGDGAHNVTVYCNDSADNFGSDSEYFSVLTTGPTVTITYPNVLYISTGVFNVTWFGTGVNYYTNNSSANIGLAVYEAQNLTEGVYTYTVTAFNAAGANASDTVGFTVDMTPPTIVIDYPANGATIGTRFPTLIWNGTDNYGIDHYTINTTAGDFDVGNVTNHTLSLPGNGNYSYNVTAYDLANNTASAIVSFTVNTSPPSNVTITYPLDNQYLNDGNITITWNSTGDVSYYMLNALNVSTNESHNVSRGDGNYLYTVTAYNPAGNDSDSVNFTVDLFDSVVTIQTPADGANLTDGNVSITWNSSDNYGVQYYTVNGTGVGLNETYNVTLGTGIYTYIVVAYDLAGNNGSDSVTFNVTVVSSCNLIINSTLDTTFVSYYKGGDVTYGNTIIQTCSTVKNSTITNSTITNSTVIQSNISDTTLVGATVIKNSYIDPSDVQDSTVSESTVLNSTVYNSTVTNHSRIVRSHVEWSTSNNSTVTDSTVLYSNIYRSWVELSNVTRSNVTDSTVYNSTVTDSDVTSSTVNGSTVTDSTVTTSDVTGSTVTDSTVTTSDVTGSTVDNSTVTDSTVTRSDVTDSTVTRSNVTDSTVTRSNVTDSTVYKSNITDSTITNSTVLNSTVTNSTVKDLLVEDANITNGWLESGCVTYKGYKYCVPPNPRKKIEDIKTLSPPTANAGPDQMVPANTIVTFNGGGSTDDKGINNYSWQIVGGAAIGTGVSPTNNFTSTGVYTITLTVNDTDGLIDSDNMTVAVYNSSATSPDLAVNDDGFSLGSPVVGGKPINATVKLYNLGSTAYNFTVRMNYSTANNTDRFFASMANGTSTPVRMTLVLPGGSFTLTAVADVFNNVTESNETNNVARMSFTGVNLAPTASFTASATTIDKGDSITFNASASTDPDGTITSYAWNFGDGKAGSGVANTHQFTSSGTYTVRLTVTDNNGGTDRATMTIRVKGTPGPNPTGPSGTSGSSTDTTPSVPTVPTVPGNETEEEIYIDNLVTYEVGDFIITRDYFYSPKTGEGWYTLNVENTGDRKVIRLEDANPYGASADESPDYTEGNRLGWERDFGEGSSFEVTYDFSEELTPSEVKSIGVPLIEDITPAPPAPAPTPEPTPEPPTSPLTGLLTFLEPDFWSGWIATLVMLALVVLVAAGWVIFKEQGYSISMTGTLFGDTPDSLEELDFNQPSNYAEGTLY
ncbi:MAG: PKD domain-containing protein [Candidatus Diapherotrites archaeon]|nr:PKD domain-containing protein [Candidatus Diapherotrites archaeon]